MLTLVSNNQPCQALRRLDSLGDLHIAWPAGMVGEICVATRSNAQLFQKAAQFYHYFCNPACRYSFPRATVGVVVNNVSSNVCQKLGDNAGFAIWVSLGLIPGATQG